MSAPVRIESEAWDDLRFRTLARILGLADADHALIKVARLWSWQAEHYTPESPTYVVDADTIDSALERAGGADAMVRARLAEAAPDGFRVCGARGRIEWLWQRRQNAKAGGEATKRKRDNKEVPGAEPRGKPAGSPPAEPNASPPVPVPVPEDQKLTPARDPSVPSVPPGESAWHRRLRWWGAMLEADARIRAAGVEPNAPSLPRTCAGENEKNMNRCEQQLLAEGRTPAEVDAAMRHIVHVAEAEALAPHHRHRRWFKPALIWDPVRATRAVDTSLKEAGTLPPQKPRPQRGDPLPPAPAPKRPERAAAPIKRTPEELAELAAMADLAAEDPRAAVAELAAKLNATARAPPRSATQDPPDQQPDTEAKRCP